MARGPSLRAWLVVVTSGLVASACTLLVSTDGLTGSPVADAGDAVTDSGDERGGPAEAGEAGEAGEGGGDAASSFACPEAGGGAQVQVGTAPYCIDRTEVTVAQYRAFLVAKAGDTSGQRADCAGNTTFVPTYGTLPTSNDSLPIQYVDFCDAVAFCTWAGKRLCGAIDGGTLDLAQADDPLASQWFRACSRNADGVHSYPYGNTFDEAKCNSYLADGAAPRAVKPVGSYPQCVGGFDGIVDMAGNVSELEDACALIDGGVRCAIRGGSFNNGYAGGSACATVPTVATQGIAETASTTGFRCCSR